MSSRRIAMKAVDWLAFGERVPPNQRAMFNALKTRSDALSSRLTSLAEKPPAIDWGYYQKVIMKAGMVDEFEKKYNALKIPEPIDTQIEKINAQEQEANKSAQSYAQASKERISKCEKELAKFKSMVPFDQMTLEDLNDAFPETKLDTVKYPFWPHKPISEL
ncbi:ATP synthase subunit d, mitochondrial [Heterodontus francisci]|uniref:ATP synthase subunit d, mitochondrial n=1 Tax=Heterodontus francisci TaxID=7792 RepID=UPI00355C38BC